MLRGLFEGWHIWVILLVVIILFGAPKLPGLAKSVGQSLKIFKNEVKDLREDDAPATPSPAAPLEGPVVDGPRTTPNTAANPGNAEGTSPRTTPPAN